MCSPFAQIELDDGDQNFQKERASPPVFQKFLLTGRECYPHSPVTRLIARSDPIGHDPEKKRTKKRPPRLSRRRPFC